MVEVGVDRVFAEEPSFIAATRRAEFSMAFSIAFSHSFT
jgi:hypothetical protein